MGNGRVRGREGERKKRKGRGGEERREREREWTPRVGNHIPVFDILKNTLVLTDCRCSGDSSLMLLRGQLTPAEISFGVYLAQNEQLLWQQFCGFYE